MLANPRIMRGHILGSFPENPLNERILWRLDSDNPYRPALYVQSSSKPDWGEIVSQAGWPNADGPHAQIADYSRLLGSLRTGAQFAFRVKVSPVQNTKTPDKPTPAQAARTLPAKRSFRTGHRTAASQLDWFLKRSSGWGFLLPEAISDNPSPAANGGERLPHDLRITARERLTFRKNGGKQHGTVTIHTALVEGRLEITDPERFSAAILSGLGPSKAYGCGLLTVAKLKSATP